MTIEELAKIVLAAARPMMMAEMERLGPEGHPSNEFMGRVAKVQAQALLTAIGCEEGQVPDVAAAAEALRLGVKSQLYSDACDDALRALTGGSDA